MTVDIELGNLFHKAVSETTPGFEGKQTTIIIVTSTALKDFNCFFHIQAYPHYKFIYVPQCSPLQQYTAISAHGKCQSSILEIKH